MKAKQLNWERYTMIWTKKNGAVFINKIYTEVIPTKKYCLLGYVENIYNVTMLCLYTSNHTVPWIFLGPGYVGIWRLCNRQAK